MPDMEESLFSLELVVEKLYIPHVVCRFPAVTFRLLDFPTIVINHVEGDLGKAIRRQISFDPDYQMPEQFCEIKDKHGNFMIKKGKSCLFKMVAETLKNHLANTPLYVMVIDMFPEVPKLVGNSTVPLNVLIDAICADLVRLGPTVPSVHGDKGLFKIYNLMGKEIGYFVLGFRLLCLGPSLIPHLPAAALVQRQSKKQRAQQQKQNKQLVEMVQLSQGEGDEEEDDDNLIETRTWGSMTDPVKHDIMMQTVEMDHKGVHVDIQAPTVTVASAAIQPTLQHQTEREPKRHRPIQHSGTQTDKKGIKMAFNAKQKVFEDLVALEDREYDEVMITNIVCPPPLFFNSEAKPHVEVEDDSYSLDTDMYVSDDITVDSVTDEEDNEAKLLSKTKAVSKEPVFMDKGQIIAPPAPQSFQNVPMNVRFANQPQQRSQRTSSSAVPQPSVSQDGGGGFPLLAALMNELLSIQNPSLFQGVQMQHPAAQISQNQVQASEHKAADKQRAASQSAGTEISPAQKKLEEINANVESNKKEYAEDKDIFTCGRKSHRKCAHPHAGVPKDKSWLRVIPEYGTGQKKSKLMFGLTNTQRLRLKKSNPAWLRSMERAEAASKGGRQAQISKNDSGDELNVSNFSDTLTEVRRQAQRELEKTAANDSLASGASSQKSPTPSSPQKTKHKSKLSPRKTSPRAGRKPVQAASPKSRSAKTTRPASGKVRRTSDTSDEPTSSRPFSVDPSVKNIMSPYPGLVPPLATGDSEDVPMSARSVDQPSSARSRSIEVRMPSVHTSQDDGSEATITDTEDEEDVPLPDESFSQNGHKKKRPLTFPSYLKQSESLPESIDGRPNQSLNTTTGLDENSPLESTRDYNREGVGNSRNMQSTDDFDTKQTFHSTSEPELQGLVSDEEAEPLDTAEKKAPAMKFPVLNPMQSDNSPIPSTRRSMAKLDMSTSQVPLTPHGADSSTPRSSRSGSPKRPTPRPRRPLRDLRESVHTESVSSYMPSDLDIMASISSGEGNYSDDFLDNSSRASPDKPERPRLIPSTKLGYTIH